MAEKELEAKDIERKVHDLAKAMKDIKSAQADRDDVVVEMRHAKLSRLELLCEDLAPVFAEIPLDAEMFDFALVKGDTPRLWVDMTSFVRLAKDGHTYEFVKDTRLGRTLLGSSENREKIGERVTNYVAERLLERERMIEGEWVAQGAHHTHALDQKTEDAPAGEFQYTLGEESTPKRANSIVSALMWFLFGIVITGGIVAGLIFFDQLEPLTNWLANVNFNR